MDDDCLSKLSWGGVNKAFPPPQYFESNIFLKNFRSVCLKGFLFKTQSFALFLKVNLARAGLHIIKVGDQYTLSPHSLVQVVSNP